MSAVVSAMVLHSDVLKIIAGLQCSWALLCASVWHLRYVLWCKSVNIAGLIHTGLTGLKTNVILNMKCICFHITCHLARWDDKCLLQNINSFFLCLGAGAVEFIISHSEVSIAFVEEKKISEVSLKHFGGLHHVNSMLQGFSVVWFTYYEFPPKWSNSVDMPLLDALYFWYSFFLRKCKHSDV